MIDIQFHSISVQAHTLVHVHDIHWQNTSTRKKTMSYDQTQRRCQWTVYYYYR
jgi:hypothetical protein